MLTFILSVILTSFICLCFFKKNFWENRYLVLLISSGVALVVTTTINFSVRGHLQTKTEIIYKKSMTIFYMPTDLIEKNSDSVKLHVINHYDWYADHKASEFYKDTTKKQTPVTIVFYAWGKKLGNHMVGMMNAKGNQDIYSFDKVYFVKSSADSVAYVSKKRQYYDKGTSNWITGFSLPHKSTITILHVPPKEFAMIPDSLIRPIPF